MRTPHRLALVSALSAPLLALGLIVAAPAAAESPDEVILAMPRICVETKVDAKAAAKQQAVRTSSGDLVVGEQISCWQASPDNLPKDPFTQAAIDAFLISAEMTMGTRGETYTAFMCHDGAVGATVTTGELPSADEAKEACTKPVLPAGVGGGILDGGGSDPRIMPGLFTGTAGLPSAGSITCNASGAANPIARGIGGGASSADISSALGHTFTGGVADSMAKDPATVGRTSIYKELARMFGLSSDASAAEKANALSRRAEAAARDANTAANDAETIARDTGSTGARAYAMFARKAAKHAQSAADDANKAALTASTSTDPAIQAQAVADAEAASKAAVNESEEAEKAKDQATEAANSGTTTGTGSGGTNQHTSTKGAQNTCETLRRQVWECEQSGWRTFECQELVRMFSGCTIDPTVALVAPDSEVCGNSTVTEDQVIAAKEKACGIQIARYAPGQDPCSIVVEGSFTPTRPGCDPTIAWESCAPDPSEGISGPDNDTVCFEAAPGTAPVPCLDPTPEGGPQIGGFIRAEDGRIFAVTGGGVMDIGVGVPGPGQSVPSSRP